MSEYKRLTDQKWTDDIDLTKEYGYSYIYKRLYELEDKIENGILVELPCKVGDTVWSVDCGYSDDGILVYFVHDTPFMLENYSHWGKEFFLTEAEAEAKLKELQEKQK